MKNIAIQRISDHFEKYKEYISNPPTEEVLGWVLHYMKKYDYSSIIEKYGIRYLLIVLNLYETLEEWEICQGIVESIKEYNKEKDTKYPTHITKINKIYA